MLNADPAIEPYADLLKQAKFNVDFPDAGPEHVIRQGILSCSAYDTKCMFLMMLPADASTESRGYVPCGRNKDHPAQTLTIQRSSPRQMPIFAAVVSR